LATTTTGFRELHAWLCSFGAVARVGVEGTGAYGAGLARFLRRAGVQVIEVDRPNRQARRSHGKCDTVDAIEAARAALSGRAKGVPKAADGNVEAIRVLLKESGTDHGESVSIEVRGLRRRLRRSYAWRYAWRAGPRR
jgi:transposase